LELGNSAYWSWKTFLIFDWFEETKRFENFSVFELQKQKSYHSLNGMPLPLQEPLPVPGALQDTPAPLVHARAIRIIVLHVPHKMFHELRNDFVK
jgi:hypothetical protein